ncbi:hypothetical protein [Jannaschia aquimarina]|uniref:hypothetical protein n=1 Tax=Jannaschia aquimarina TaxID=935700 RepID=UPI0011329679|nr:hypothetical protein [Jannaschia aquimarina]
MIRLARRLGVTDFRDGMAWRRVEQRPGVFDFTTPRTGYPRLLLRTDADVGVVLNWGNPIYEGGDTPTSPEGIRAFGSLAGALVSAFPEIDNLEIGNEFNGTNFVRGPIARMSPLERARAYVPLLREAAIEARLENPDIRIIGGSTHSLPAGYLWEVLEAGGAPFLDALAIHPYTTPAEQLVRQVEVLRRHPLARDLPLEVTEFGHPDPRRAAAHFVRNYCQMGLAGVTRAIWYPMNRRDDGMVPLFTPDGRVTPAGRAYRLIAARMEDRPLSDASTDAVTYGCLYGEDVLVLWGAPRDVSIGDDVQVFSANGRPTSPPYRLDRDEPLIFTREGGDISNEIELGAHGILADSFDHYGYPRGDETQGPADPFERFARRGGELHPLLTRPGQETGGVPWFPYRAPNGMNPARLSADSLVPAGTDDDPVEILHRYVAETDQVLDLAASFAAAARSADGIRVRVTRGEEILADIVDREPIELAMNAVELAAGQTLDIAVGPNLTPRGDVTRYRITLSKS